MFSDESRFTLFVNDGRQRVWHRCEERYFDAATTPYDRFGRGSLTVCGGVTINGRTDPHLSR